MKTKKYVDFDNEVQEEIKQCLMEDRLATTKTSSLKQAKEFVYNTFVPDGLMNNGEYYIDEVRQHSRPPSGKENSCW